jgi:hypothetical protein
MLPNDGQGIGGLDPPNPFAWVPNDPISARRLPQNPQCLPNGEDMVVEILIRGEDGHGMVRSGDR